MGTSDYPAPALSALILSSYKRIVGAPLTPCGFDNVQAARWLYEEASFCVLAHNAAVDPIFIYANQAAQRRFEYSWAQFVTLPSRLSAEAPNRAERGKLLDQVAEQGFTTNYTGMRIGGSGRRFLIEGVTVWQLFDDNGVAQGQGAIIPATREVTSRQADSP